MVLKPKSPRVLVQMFVTKGGVLEIPESNNKTLV